METVHVALEMDAVLSSIVTDNVNTSHATCLVIDLIATIHCIAEVPNSFRELALQLLHQIPVNVSNSICCL